MSKKSRPVFGKVFGYVAETSISPAFNDMSASEDSLYTTGIGGGGCWKCIKAQLSMELHNKTQPI